MDGTARRRIGALLVSATLLASLTLVAVTAVTSAAPPTCRGETATIVGTDEGEVIVGTDGADVIVALGGDDTVRSLEGADIVCAGAGTDSVHGGTGRDALEGGNADDALIGGKGRDRLRGNAGDDDLDGGLHRDTCFQNAGTGSKVSCENPFAAPTPKPTPVPQAPKPTPAPTPTPKPKTAFQTTCEGYSGTYKQDASYVPAGFAPPPGITYSESCEWIEANETDFYVTWLVGFKAVCGAPNTLLSYWKGVPPGALDWYGCASYQTNCKNLGGTYVQDPTTYPPEERLMAPSCKWNGMASDAHVSASAQLDALCPPTTFSGFGAWSPARDPDWVGCRLPA